MYVLLSILFVCPFSVSVSIGCDAIGSSVLSCRYYNNRYLSVRPLLDLVLVYQPGSSPSIPYSGLQAGAARSTSDQDLEERGDNE